MESASKKTVRANVLAFLGRLGPLRERESGVTKLKNLGVSHGNAQRTVDQESDMRLATLDQVAAALKMKPWQLLVETFDPASPPVLAAGSQQPAKHSARALEVATLFDALAPRRQRLLYAQIQDMHNPDAPDADQFSESPTQPVS